MNYEIITEPEKLREFIAWLPVLKPHEKFYACLFSRKKYAGDLIKGNDKSQIKRFLSDKDRLFDKIRQLEVAVGTYKLKHSDVPQESLALYINPNPRDLKKATYDGIIRLTELLKSDSPNHNPHAELLNCIQKSSGKKVYLDFDIDTKDFDFDKLRAVINTNCLTIVETHGGYHLLVKVEDVQPEFRKSFYNDIHTMGVDQTGDQLLPVPGCTQGGFTPRFVELF
ncbi:MAG: hypothetical protein HEP71_21535 [Roseivirga sp.]|nr:hypothetical protein [Roseivirga sp.]